MSAPHPRGEGLAVIFGYIRQLLEEQNRPMIAEEIAQELDFWLPNVVRSLENACHDGAVVLTSAGYVLGGPR